MKNNEYGIITDLFFSNFVESENYIKIHNFDNPTYRMGNRLYLKSFSSVKDLEDQFNFEFKQNKQIEHFVFSYNSNKFEILDKFLESGYEVENSYVMKLGNFIKPNKTSEDIEIKELNSDQDWEKMLLNQEKSRLSAYPKADFFDYLTPKINVYRELIKKKKGKWFGAFINKDLVADVGVFFDNNIARFQLVATNPQYRRRKVCSTLLRHVINEIKTDYEDMIILADPDYHAMNLYSSLGFEKVYLETTMIKKIY